MSTKVTYCRALICDKGHACFCSTMHTHLLKLTYRLHREKKIMVVRKVDSSKWQFQSDYSQILANVTKMIAFLDEVSCVTFLPQYYRPVSLAYCEFPDGCNIVLYSFLYPIIEWLACSLGIRKENNTLQSFFDRESARLFKMDINTSSFIYIY